MSAFSFLNLGAILAKEFIQMRRDRVTFAMMLAIPILLLVLFGYAINTDPKRLDAALLAMGRDPLFAGDRRGARGQRLLSLRRRPKTMAEAEELIASGDVAFVVVIPSDFGARVDRGDKPEILVVADATDPAAASGALASLTTVAQRALLRQQGREAEAAEAEADALTITVHRRYNPAGVSQLISSCPACSASSCR